MRRSSRLDFLIVAAIGLLVVVAAADSLRSKESSPSPPPPVANPDVDSGELGLVPPRPTPTQEVQETSDRWAHNFADGVHGCDYMTQPLCERVACEEIGHPRSKMKNCAPPTRAFRRSFAGVLVFDVAFKGNRAAARFSNGKVIELWGDAGSWRVHKIGPHAGRGFFAHGRGNRFSSPTDNRE